MESNLTKKEMASFVNKMSDCINLSEKKLNEIKKLQIELDHILLTDYFDSTIVNEYVSATVKNLNKNIESEAIAIENNLNNYMAILKVLNILAKLNLNS